MNKTREEWAEWLCGIAPDLSLYRPAHFMRKADEILLAISSSRDSRQPMRVALMSIASMEGGNPEEMRRIAAEAVTKDLKDFK